jgi:hypothetical protein
MSDSEILVRVENVSKKFCKSLKRSLWYGVKDIASELNPLRGKTADYRLQTRGMGRLQTADCRLQTRGMGRLQTADCRLQTRGMGRLQTADCRLQTLLQAPSGGSQGLQSSVFSLIPRVFSLQSAVSPRTRPSAPAEGRVLGGPRCLLRAEARGVPGAHRA